MRKRKEIEAPVLPQAGDTLPVIELTTRHTSGHPWVFRRMVGEPYSEIEPGTLVEVLDKHGQHVGRGFYNPYSEIAIRLLTTDRGAFPERRWFLGAITRAVRLRHDVLKLPSVCNAYRLIHSEGDGLSGLVADKYDKTIVLQLFSAGIHRHLEWIKQGFAEHFPDHEIIVKSDHRTEKLEGLKMDGPPPQTREVVIHEHNLKLNVDLRRGHKTGYFLDQRENRRRVAELCAGQDVFDGFCYTGGFALSATLGGAQSVEAVDLDEEAIELAEKNKKLNELGDALKFVHGNVFDILRDRRSAGKKYTRMILDPAKLAVSRNEIPKALSAYADMNRLGMQCVAPGGILVSCSCTGLVSEEDFLMALRAAAAEAQVELQIIGIYGAPGDHPWAVRVPEGRYLKVVFSRVMPLK
ncbi:MAG TPA: class I SAM-dependent rRNA methyltransferase [Planctomycetota bacterium]|nr:class I SAM-dependent rRNA methyltransferase [Planctomycetota bacterium]